MTAAARRIACVAALAACFAALGVVLPQESRAKSVALGAYIPQVGTHSARIDRYARLMGRRPVIASDYKQWDFDPFVRRELSAIWRREAVPMITWEPFSYHGRRYPLRAIVRGRYDRYVRRSARAAAAWGRPILLRFAHEMNGNWYPWGRGREGNTPRRYKAAWRRLVRIFRRHGAHNVKWVWTPNVVQGRAGTIKRYFPGERWVDWVGLDGFNWGFDGRYRSFRAIFADSYRRLTRISRRPVMIAETGATNAGKARWISEALGRQVHGMRRIRALIWFNRPVNGVDLRLDSSRASLRAFRRAARKGRYRTDRQWLLDVPTRFSPTR